MIQVNAESRSHSSLRPLHQFVIRELSHSPERAIVAALELHVAMSQDGNLRANAKKPAEANDDLPRSAFAVNLADSSNFSAIRSVQRRIFENTLGKTAFVRLLVVAHEVTSQMTNVTGCVEFRVTEAPFTRRANLCLGTLYPLG